MSQLPIRKAVQAISAYQGPRPLPESSDVVRLASNENPRGPSPNVINNLSVACVELNRYPDGPSTRLKSRLAERHGVSDQQVVIGNGSNDIIALTANAMLEPGVNAVFSDYSFAIYPLATQAAGAIARSAAATADYGHDLSAMKELVDADTRIVFVANPNNPTGTSVDSRELKKFVASLPETTVVFLDCAYSDYVDDPDYPDYCNWRDVHPGIVLSYTFSKAYGMASLRLGYGISNPELAATMHRLRQPFNVNAMAQMAGLLALDDPGYISETVAMNNSERERVARELGKIHSIKVYESQANFLMIKVADTTDADTVTEQLYRQGVLVRSLASYHLPQHLRVTIGTPEQNTVFLAAINTI